MSEIMAEDGKSQGSKDIFRRSVLRKGRDTVHGNVSESQVYLWGCEQSYRGLTGLQAANHLTDSLREHGIEMFRFKTGTPARVDKKKH